MTKYWKNEAECIPRTELEQLKGEKLKKLAQYVYENGDSYRKRFKEMGFTMPSKSIQVLN